MKPLKYTFYLFLLFAIPNLQSQSVKLDTSFNHTGILNSTWGTGGERISSMALQKDGKIIAAGEVTAGVNFHILLERFLTNGSIDTTFGKNGISISALFGGIYSSSHAYALALQNDGKIVLAGIVTEAGVNNILLTRFLPNGTLDSLFNTIGYLVVKTGGNSSANALRIGNDGNILVAGTTLYNGKNSFFALKSNSNGLVDMSFGLNGMAITPIGNGNSFCYALDLLPGGSVILGGYSHNGSNNDFAVVKLDANGKPDSSFSQDGKLLIDFNKSQDYGIAMAIQNDGKIVLGGQSYESNQNHFAMIRITPFGEPDTSFSLDGKLITHINSSASDIRAIALQTDGKIIAAGGGSGKDAALTKSDFAAVRYLTDGSLDLNFGSSGIFTQDFENAANVPLSLLTLANQSMLLGGYSLINSNSDIMLLKLQPDGIQDSSFNKTGLIVQDLNLTHSFANRIRVQQDGKILAGGYSNYYDSYEYTAARYDLYGKVDSSFSADGLAILFFSQDQDICNDLAIQDDGRIIQLGTSTNSSGLSSIMLLRFLENGSADNSFDSDGKVISTLSSTGSEGTCLQLQKDQKILAGGMIYDGINANFALVRYLPSGKPDSSFGLNGIVTTDFGSNNDRANAISLQSDGKILLAGSTTSTDQTSFAISRYQMDGHPDLSFNQTGTLILNIADAEINIAKVIKLQNDGKILVGGFLKPTKFNNSFFALFRLNADGSLDSGFSTDGKLVLDLNNESNDISDFIFLANDQILLAGNSFDGVSNKFTTILISGDGSLQKAYGINGFATFNAGSEQSELHSAAMQADGKILLCGHIQNEQRISTVIMRLALDLHVGTKEIVHSLQDCTLSPNPFTNSFSLNYLLSKDSKLNIKLVDLQGQNVCTFLDQVHRTEGEHEEHFEIPANIRQGIYALLIQSSDSLQSILLNHY